MRIRNLNRTVPILLSILSLSCNLKTDGNSLNATLEKEEMKEAKKSSKAPIMGWASWNNYRVNINEEIIKSQADAMVSSGLKDAGYSFINIDDGF